ncbi:hypothetical protein GW17_00058482, partial [Ensete ventricosum]
RCLVSPRENEAAPRSLTGRRGDALFPHGETPISTVPPESMVHVPISCRTDMYHPYQAVQIETENLGSN